MAGSPERGEIPSVVRTPATKRVRYNTKGEGELVGSVFDLAYGGAPVAPPREYHEIKQRLQDDGTSERAGRSHAEVDVRQGAEFLKARYDLPQDVEVIFSGAGSDYLLGLIFGEALNPRTEIFAVGPTFPRVAKIVHDKADFLGIPRGEIYKVISTRLDASLEETLDYAVKSRRRMMRRDAAIYVAIPDTPKGDSVPLSSKRELAKAAKDRGDVIVFDGALEEAFEDQDSAVHLTKEFDNIIWTSSLSKVHGLAGERIGYAAMHKNIAERINLLLPAYYISGPQQKLINEIMNPDILVSHLKNVVWPFIEERKTLLMRELNGRGIKYLPTSPKTPFLTIRTYAESVFEFLANRGIRTAPGLDFTETFERGQLRNTEIRMTIPEATEDIPRIADATLTAIRMAHNESVNFLYKSAQ